MANALTTAMPLGLSFNLATTNAGQILFITAPGGAGGVTSFAGRTGDVVPQTGDYTSSQITNLSGTPGANTTAALNALGPALKQGTTLTNASVTLTPTGVSRYNASAGTFSTVARDLLIAPAGFTTNQAVQIAFDVQTNNVTVTNNGPAGPTVIYTFVAGVKATAVLMKDAAGNIYVDRELFTEALA